MEVPVVDSRKMDEAMEKAAAAECRLKQIKECLEFKDSIGIKTFILEEKMSDQTIFWEVASELIKRLTSENLENSPHFFETCQRCLNYVIENGNPKELLLALLEQADSFKDDDKFKILLDGVQKVLFKLPNKRHHSLDITMETLSAHIEALPVPKDHDLEGDERKLLELDSDVIRITDVLIFYLRFLKPFVCEVSSKNENSKCDKYPQQVAMLTRYVMKLLAHPVPYLDVTFNAKEEDERKKSYSRECSETIVETLQLLCPSFWSLIEDERERRRVEEIRANEKKKKMEERKRDNDKELGEDEEDTVQDWEKNEKISDLSLACLSYLVLGESLGIDNFPSIHTHSFMLRFHLPSIILLLKNNHSIVKHKGVRLLNSLISKIAPLSLDHHELENAQYKEILNLLIECMTRCANKSLRQECVQLFSWYLRMFSMMGRYRLYEVIFNTCTHSGMTGYTVGLFKEELDRVLRQDTPLDQYVGSSLYKMLKLVSAIPDGATTDLLENSDRIIAVLNFIRYLILRDTPNKNVTGFWDFFPDIEKDFLAPLRLAIDMSKGHYNLDLENVKNGKEIGSHITNMEVEVGGTQLGAVPQGEKIALIESALNTFDMMHSILSRIIELADMQKRTVK